MCAEKLSRKPHITVACLNQNIERCCCEQKQLSVSPPPRSEEDSEGNRDICSEILQIKALERLTSTVSVCRKPTSKCSCCNHLNCVFIFISIFSRYKASWLQLSPERLVKLVSIILQRLELY